MRSGFSDSPWADPLDVDEAVRRTPKDATVKGMFFNSILDLARQRQVTLEHRTSGFIGFKDYPLRDYVVLLADGAAAVFPDVPMRRALRQLGQIAYPTLRSSMIGRVVFGAIGRDVPAVLRLAAKGYAISASIGTVEVLEMGSNEALLRLSDIFTFPDSYHVGIFEGAVSVHGSACQIGVRHLSDTAVEFDLRWTPAPER